MRILALAIFVLCTSTFLPARAEKPRTNPGKPCGDDSKGLPGFYYEAVLARISPPENSLLSISLTGEKTIVLEATGDRFELWADTFDIPQKTIHQFLMDLDQQCHLPVDPQDAAALVKVRWESREISPTQFLELHRDFLQVLSAFVSKARDRDSSMLETKMLTMHLDAFRFTIVYENHTEHIEVQAWDVPEKGKPMDPVVKWALHLQKLAEDKFHRPFTRLPSE